MKKQILEKIKMHNVCVLATCLKDKTEAAAMNFVVDDNFIFYLQTSRLYRKYRNLVKNKNVSLVIGFKMPCVQIDGIAEFLKPEEIEIIKPFMIEKLPDSEGFIKSRETVFIKVKPKFLRMTDFIKGNYKFNEIKF